MNIETPDASDFPAEWPEHNRQKIANRLDGIAESIEAELEAGKTPEEIVRGWRAYASTHNVQIVDFDYVEGEGFRITVSEESE